MSNNDKSRLQGLKLDDAQAEPRRVREPWHAPAMTVLPAAETETGVNSNTDVNSTFS